MDSGKKGCKKSATTRTPLGSVAPPIQITAKDWTTEKWSKYLPKLQRAVQRGEAPIELYLHGVEILCAIQPPTWECLHSEEEDEATKTMEIQSPNQRGTSSGQEAPETNQTYSTEASFPTQSFMKHWSIEDWQWVFMAAQSMQEYGPWVHHLAHQIAPKTLPSPSMTESWPKVAKQRHAIAVKDVWGAHLRQVEYLVANAQAPDHLLAITKQLYVETMISHSEGQDSSEDSSSQASSTPQRRWMDASEKERQRIVIQHLWQSDQGLQEIAEVEEGHRGGNHHCSYRLIGIYQSISALQHHQRFSPEWRTKKTGPKWMQEYGEFWQHLPKPAQGWTKADWNSLLIAMELRGVTDPAIAPILQEHWQQYMVLLQEQEPHIQVRLSVVHASTLACVAWTWLYASDPVPARNPVRIACRWCKKESVINLSITARATTTMGHLSAEPYTTNVTLDNGHLGLPLLRDPSVHRSPYEVRQALSVSLPRQIREAVYGIIHTRSVYSEQVPRILPIREHRSLIGGGTIHWRQSMSTSTPNGQDANLRPGDSEPSPEPTPASEETPFSPTGSGTWPRVASHPPNVSPQQWANHNSWIR